MDPNKGNSLSHSRQRRPRRSGHRNRGRENPGMGNGNTGLAGLSPSPQSSQDIASNNSFSVSSETQEDTSSSSQQHHFLSESDHSKGTNTNEPSSLSKMSDPEQPSTSAVEAKASIQLKETTLSDEEPLDSHTESMEDASQTNIAKESDSPQTQTSDKPSDAERVTLVKEGDDSSESEEEAETLGELPAHHEPKVLVIDRKKSPEKGRSPPEFVTLPWRGESPPRPLLRHSSEHLMSASRVSPPKILRRNNSERALSPTKFSYGLGSSLGKPGYVSVPASAYGDDDDPWVNSIRSRNPSSIAVVTESLKKFTKRQYLALIVIAFADLLSAMTVSLQAPFYPAEAERKGASPTEFGLVFGSFELAVFLVSPIFGKYMNKIGPKLVFNGGIFTTATCCVLFGFLDKINDHVTFIALSFAIRITEAIGNAAFVTASFTIIAAEFPESVATTFASLETSYGLGLILGPSVGGVLYELGGYTLPFAATGISLIVMAVLTAFILPKTATFQELDEHGNETEGYGIFSILKIPSVLLAAVSLVVCATSLGFLSATLEPHLRQFQLTPVQVGLVFIINGGVYAMTAPGFGWICDKISQPKFVTLFGAIFILIAFLLVGPASFIPLDTILWVTCVGLVVHGLGCGCVLVSSFIIALHDSMDYGFPDNISTYGVVSGLWTSMLSLGAFIGPSVGGFLLDHVGFRNGTYFILGAELVIFVTVLIFIICNRRPQQNSEEEVEPLLRDIPTLTQDVQKGKSQKSYGAAKN